MGKSEEVGRTVIIGAEYRAMWQRILDMDPTDELAIAVLEEFDAIAELGRLGNAGFTGSDGTVYTW